jgi:hypothetical protein
MVAIWPLVDRGFEVAVASAGDWGFDHRFAFLRLGGRPGRRGV